jgi:diguanylate cyclase (GGDEF)-like protein/PAS domain S-box-containing protein
MDHLGPDRHDPPAHVSPSAHVREHAQKAASHPSEGWLRTLLENTSDVICVLRADGTFSYISPAVKRVLGYLPEDVVGTVGFDYVHPEEAALVAEAFAQIVETPGVHTPVEFRVRTADGSLRHVQGVPNNQLEDPLLRGVVVTFRDLTDRVQAEEKVRFQARLLDAVGQAVIATDWQGKVIYWNRAAEVLYGWSAGEAMGRSGIEATAPENLWERADEIMSELRTMRSWSGEYEMRRKDGTLFHAMLTITPVLDEQGNLVGITGVTTDITELRRAEERLKETEERYRSLVEQMPALIYVDTLDGVGSRGYTSPQAEAMLGYSLDEWTADTALWAKLLHTEDRERVVAERVRANANGEPLSLEYRMIAKDGRVVWLRDDSVILYDSAGRPQRRQGVLFDITERKALEAQLEQQVLHDSLTGLPNRVLFSDRLQHALAHAQRRGSKLAVLFMDLDNFKLINDSLGHKAGDELLVGVAERLRTSLRPEDTAARLGGDEFAVLLEDLAHVGVATRVAERIADKLRAPFALGEREMFVTASIGVAIGGGTIRLPEELLRDADVAMYRAKHSGKARYAVFEEAMSARALERLELGNDLRRALEREEFAVHYQPKVSLATSRIVGFEALVRWEHPERGHMPPGRFVPLAEETGLIVPIGRRVLREACRQVKEWQRRFPSDPPLVVCVNLSARQLRDPGLYRTVAKILGETDLDPSSLDLEITESTAMEDAPTTAAVLEELRASGVQVIIDDFGTGYSSLSHLERFRVDYIKIDRSFVGKLEEETGAKVLVKGMIDLAHALGLEVIAEGVETVGQLARLREMGCDMAQGHYFSEPLPSEAVDTLLEKQHP